MLLLGWKDDIREAVRRIRRNPRTSLLAGATLAVGIGAAAGVFTVAHTVLLSPPPYRDSARIVEITARRGNERSVGVSPADLADLRREGLLEAATLITYGEFSWTGQSLAGFDGSEVLRGLLVSPDYFRVLDRPMAAGRGFAPGEDGRGRNQVAVLSYGLWQRRFAGRYDAIGQTITLNGSVVTVVGVAARDFLSFENYDVSIWMPLDGARWPRDNRVYSLARLAPGVTVETANLRLKTVSERLAAAYPATNRGYVAAVEPMFERLHRQVRDPVLALGIAVLCLLAIAALNVASLLLARATKQSREMAIRAALGAGRVRLFRMVLIESTILAIAASVGGALIGAWLLEGVRSMVPESLQVGWMFAVDARTYGIALVLAIGGGLAAGMAPALESFSMAMGGLRPAPGRHRLLRGIVTIEIAAAVALTVAAGLLAKGFVTLAHRPLGYRTDHVLGLRVRLRGDRYRSIDAKAAYWGRLIETARAIPGVALAATVSDLPMGQQYSGGSFEVEGLTLPRGPDGAARRPQAHMLMASQGYFAAMGIPLLRGRGFTEADGPQSEPVAIVSDAAAAAYWPGQDPIGKRIRGWWSKDPWRRIVGVVGRIRHSGPEYDFEHEIYAPYRQVNSGTMFLVLRTHVAPDSVGAEVRSVMASLDPEVPPFEMRSMQDRFEQVIAMDRIAPVLMSVFSVFAALLAALGLFGVIGYWVSQRTRELGIRAAVGARRRELRWLILRQGGRMAGVGIGAGIAAMLPLSRLMRGTIYGINECDWTIYAAAVGLIAGAALVACWAPAERAARIEPNIALREE